MRRSVQWTCAITLVAGAAGCAQHRARSLPRPGPAVDVAGSELTDSVAIGYGMRARRDLTGAVGTVDGRTAQRDGVLRVEEMLRRVPGVMVSPLANGSFSVRVRGGTTQLTTGASTTTGEPLFVLDGMPLLGGPGALNNVPPNDVERIDVLKDAEGAIYGSRGANGVILVRTRRWKQ